MILEFYNTNLYRAYPFVEQAALIEADFPRAAIVDMCVVFNPSAGFDQSNPAHKINPVSAWMDGADAKMKFIIVAPGSEADANEITVSFADASDFDKASLTMADGYGYAVMGQLAAFTDAETDTPSDTWLEPACIQTTVGHYVETIQLYNVPRSTAVDLCWWASHSSVVSDVVDYLVAPGTAQTSNVALVEGYNCDIAVLTTANGVRVSAGFAAGLGVCCSEVARTDEEVSRLADGEHLDLALRCTEALLTINGIGPDGNGKFNLTAGKGIFIAYPSSCSDSIVITADTAFEGCND